MNAHTETKADRSVTGLDLLRAPFPANQISKLPKPTKAQTDEVRNNFKAGIRCTICGGWHHPKVVHLDYVGHAALTDRLLDADPGWNWEPVAFTERGTPAIDENGGMWIKLTVCGVTRYGYGHPDGKKGGDAIKELIGDALRNAAMRFGAALDLWHKGDLHALDDAESPTGSDAPRQQEKPAPQAQKPARDPVAVADGIIAEIKKRGTVDELRDLFGPDTRASAAWDWLALDHPEQSARVNEAKAAREKALRENPPIEQNEIPY